LEQNPGHHTWRKKAVTNHPHHCYYCKTTFVLFEEVIKHSTENHGSLMLKVKYLELSYINWEISDNVPQNDDQLDPNPEFRSVSLWIAHIEWNEMYWENHPYHCYYCKTTFVLFEEVIKHSTENHGSLMLKVKYLECYSKAFIFSGITLKLWLL
jgi:hypothetical protein